MGDSDLAALAAPHADGSGWACVPFDIDIGGMNFHGFFRIWYYSTMRSIGRLIADIRFGDERRLLELFDSGDTARIAYFADNEIERNAFVKEFDGVAIATASSIDSGDFSELWSRKSVDEDA